MALICIKVGVLANQIVSCSALLGKLRHVQAICLWVQERVAKNELKIVAVGTKQNVSDLCTRPMNKDPSEKQMKSLNLFFAKAKASGAKTWTMHEGGVFQNVESHSDIASCYMVAREE